MVPTLLKHHLDCLIEQARSLILAYDCLVKDYVFVPAFPCNMENRILDVNLAALRSIQVMT